MPLTGWALHRFFENFRENSLKGDLSNDITLNPPLFSLVNTFKNADLLDQKAEVTHKKGFS